MKETTTNESGDLLTAIPDTSSIDGLFDALSNERRRRVVRFLNERPDPIALADLADEIAARENGAPVDETDPDDAERVYVSLYHTHVPKLADRGLLEYDRDRGLVAPPDHVEEIGRFIDLAAVGADRSAARRGRRRRGRERSNTQRP